MRIKLFQLEAVNQKEHNLRKILQFLDNSDCDLNVFPEYIMGVNDRSLTREYVERIAEPINGDFVSSILEKSREKGVAVVFTMFLKEDGKIYNAAIFANKGKILSIYKKIHLFDAFGYKESSIFTPGIKPTIVSYKGCRIGLAVCFDLRFPELFRFMRLKGASMFIVPSAWYKGKYKLLQWFSLIQSRAHENGCYIIAVNQVGRFFTGHSLIASPLGYIVVDLGEEEKEFSVELDLNEVEEARKNFRLGYLWKGHLYREWFEEL